MKNFSLLLLTTLLLFSCSSDDASDGNGFYLDGSLKSTNHGYSAHQPQAYGAGYEHIIILSDGTINSDSFDINFIEHNNYSNNTSNLIKLIVNSKSLTTIEEGTYTLDNSQGAGYLNMVFFLSGVTVTNNVLEDYNYESYSDNASAHKIISGSLTITKTGTRYNLNYTFLQNEGTSIQGRFSGELTELQYKYW
ncbi:hypothetical protein [Flavobacterium sp. GT3R68]|uniref:hypothetical protein n=1 Tax=Flavobacterium sp. GT3R68 TaxID=2594437 RepID=UPI000F86DDEE|nr:hypothetical protein [Flavobacterium sp. GT3R68]RTY89136.1 hypothetical protein EKL32_24245 [Flavobacterium sp. GSN2]TRW90066.1 hypothetical protein FNW07_11445 [Flavobacterium sp. GT3R68]